MRRTDNVSTSIEQLSETRQSILYVMKREGAISIAKLSSLLDMTKEAVRQHILQLEAEGWIEKRTKKQPGILGGRPSKYYSLTTDGEHLFPKHYDSLTIEVIDKIADELGSDILVKILSKMTDERVREWEPRLKGLSLEQRLEILKEFYFKNDKYMEVQNIGNKISLVEQNCPFLNVAKHRPMLCSVTVSTLSRLLGYQVIRKQRFQEGDGRCVFQVQLDQPVDKDFKFKLEE